MNTEVVGVVLAIITLHPEMVAGGAPIFVARNEDEQKRIALILSRVLKGMVHDLENGTYIIVKH